MAKSSSEDNPLQTNNIDTRLDAVLVTALRENFEIQDGHHMDRFEMLEFLKSVVKKHADLEFVLHHRDTKLSGRIYKAFPRVTTKRVAVPNERGKKVWRYTNLKRIIPESELSTARELDSDEIPEDQDDIEKNSLLHVPEKPPKDEPCTPNSSTENGNDASADCPDNSVSGLSTSEDIDSETNVGNMELESDLGQFSDMLKWIKENFVLDTHSSVQVKFVVDGIKAAFHNDITYKQSHKLVFSVFPGTTSRVANPVRLEVRGSYYSYRGIASQSKQAQLVEEPVNTSAKVSKPKPAKRAKIVKSVCTKQTWVPPFAVAENAKANSKQSRKQFLKSCAVLKDNLDPRKSYDSFPTTPDSTTMMEREGAWQRMVDELKQERDQAIKERNQAMISLMELERDQPTEFRSADDAPRQPAACHDAAPNVVSERGSFEAKSEENVSESRDWLRSLINRSNHILGEQMSEANAKYFPGLTLQNTSALSRPPKYRQYSGDFIEMDRFEKLKSERDLIWKSLMEKLKREKEDIIQQLRLEKMDVIQKMELEKSDAIEGVQEKLSNQVTILSRELREVKELLNHTMDERTLAIEHAQKLMKLIDEKTLKEANLDNFPFDVMEDQCVHLPRQISPSEAGNPVFSLPGNKTNKRKQSMPAKLKKNMKISAPNSEKYVTDTKADTLCCSGEPSNSETGKASSIDYLNSIVENIGRNSPCQSLKNYSTKTDVDSCPVEG